MRQRTSSRQVPAARRTPAVGALDAGLRLLARRAHSRAELQRKLARRGHPEEEIESALARLDELGYVDDSAFAEGLVRRRSASRGPRALSAELAKLGVGRAQADKALASYDSALQLASAMRSIERSYGKREIKDYNDMLNRVGSRLLRQGFSAITVRAACRAIISGTPPDAEA